MSKLLKDKQYILIFIQEHWLSAHEASSKFESDFSEYKFITTSSDSSTAPEDILCNPGPVWHGTALGWLSSINNKVSKLQIVSERFCRIKINTDNLEILAFTAYLPTSGKDDEYLEIISTLIHQIHEHISLSSMLIIGLDANISDK